MTTKASVAHAVLGLALVLGGPGAAAAATDDFEVRALAERLLSITGLLPSHALILELRRVADDPSHDIEIRERALAEYAFGLRDYPPEPASWAALEFLAAYRERSLEPHPEAAAYQVPRFNVAATSRGTINLWLRLTARRRAAEDLVAGRIDFLDRAERRGHRQQIAGIVDALNRADPPRLVAVRDALKSRLRGDPSLVPIALAVASGLGDETLLDQAIAHAAERKFRIVYDLDRYLDDGRAARRWREFAGADDPELAAAAMAALADKTTPDASLFDLLAARLRDPELGMAAAAALARVRLGSGVTRLAALLNSDDALVATRAALALKLNGSPAALAALRASPLDEVQQWLR